MKPTSQSGVHSLNLTPSLINFNAPEQACYRWFIKQDDVADDERDVINSCPPNLALLELEEMIWESINNSNSSNICYRWKFLFVNG